jgi:hypothetical protein
MKFGHVELTTRRLLVLLAVMLTAMVLLTPEQRASGGGRSSFSTDPGGARVAYELAQRMRWHTTRRTTTLDSLSRNTSVQVVIGAQDALGAAETHNLLEHVRHGGGLIFSADGGGMEIADSLGIALGVETYMLPGADASSCTSDRPRVERSATFLPPSLRDLIWKRPPPGVVHSLVESPRRGESLTTVAGFTMGRGRVVALSTSELFANEALRVCAWGADVAVARAYEYARSDSAGTPTMEFDEFHHGFGTHPGSMKAIAMYLSRTRSGHFLAQALVAALVLLIAAAPRPVVPTDPERVIRRSPLEHADALAYAYMDVGASRTATSRLVNGLKRRAGRVVSVDDASDGAFLDAIERRSPTLHDAVAVVRRGLHEQLHGREIIGVGQAIATIEQVLTTTPPTNA